MRRFRLKTFLFAAAVVLAACDPHEFPVSDGGDAMRDFSLKLVFDDELPDHQQVLPTKAEEAAQPRYTILLWRYEREGAFGLDPDYIYSFTRSAIAELDTTIYLPVRPAKYRVAAWVDWTGGDAGSGYDTSDPEHIVFPAEYPTGEHARDAFTMVMDYDPSGYLTVGETYQKTVTLRRPVAQLRIVAPEALTFLAMTGLDPSQMQATVRYKQPIYEGYNVLMGTLVGSREGVSLTGTPRFDASGELVFLSDFVFFPDESAKVTIDFTLSDLVGKQIIVFSGEVPLRSSHSTTVSFDTPYGGDEKPGGIGISPGFDDEIEVPID